VGRRDSETPDTIDIDGENTIISFEGDAGKMSSPIPRKEIIDGGIDMGTKGRKNVKKPKEQVSDNKTQKAEQKKG
jgi:hypothetical protein